MLGKWIAAAALGTAGILGASGAALATTGTTAHAATAYTPAEQATIPSNLKVPKGNKLLFTLHVLQGVQVYQCENSAWVDIEPDSNMGFAGSTKPTVLYTAGPKWVSTVDGSDVVGMPVASDPQTGAIPWLLVKAVSHRGDGQFGVVSYIQRIDTRGGLAPEGSCSTGAITASQYYAVERFWVPTSS